MKTSFLLVLLTISCRCSLIATNSPQRSFNIARYKSRNFIIKCCGFASCVSPTFVARTTSTTHSNAQTDLTLATDNVRLIGETEITDDPEMIVVDDQYNQNNVASTGKMIAATPAPILTNAPIAVGNTVNAATTSNILVPGGTTMLPAVTSANTPEGTTSNAPTTLAPISSACVQSCPALCNCSGKALVLDAKGELTSEAMKANFILKCGKEVNTTAFYFSRPNLTDFNTSETACCSICSVPISTSSVKKRSVLQECIYDFQKAYLENVNGEMKVVFSVAGFRGDCSFLVGKTFSIKWEPIAFCQSSVRLFGSNNTACSVVNSWQTCGNQIQNQKLPADPYCQIIGPTTCGQSFTYSCLTSNNLTTFQSLTQGLLLERVSNWAYFLYRQTADPKDYTQAFNYCESRMMYLAYFDTLTELNAVLQWYKTAATQINGSNIVHAIIGVDDIAVDGKFVVAKTGAPALFLKWVGAEPDGGAAQGCVAINTNYPSVGSVGMVDYGCGWQYLFICKIPAEFVWIV